MSLDNLIKALNRGRKFPVILADDPDSPCVVEEWVSTGCTALDIIMGGGLPVGRIVEVYGDTSTGKSLVAAQVAAAAQKEDYVVLYIDTERAVSLEMIEEVGVDISNLIYSDPDTIEEVFQLMEDILEAKSEDQRVVIIWDSIAATTAQSEKDADYGKSTMGRHALLLSQGLRKFNRLISKHNACALFLNQTRQKIGVMFGDNEATFGGKAVPFYSSIRVRLKKGKKIKADNKIIGIMTTAIVVKNKVAIPFLDSMLPIYFGEGIDDAEASFLFMKEDGILPRGGSWYELPLESGAVKFQQKNWNDLYDEHYDEIIELMWSG